MDKYSVLKQYFGHSSFRQGQETLIDAILSGHDVLGIMPTGGGKSLCYQIPALLLPGVTLVISPLISLMTDQVAALRESGIHAAFLNSALTAEQSSDIYRQVRQGKIPLLYVAPERLESERFLSLVKQLHIPLIAVDEAHCISQWGQDFRPSYLGIADFIADLPQRPVVAALTATATAEVQSDIIHLLKLQTPTQAVTGFDRPNLYFEVQHPENRTTTLLTLLKERPNKCGIVYCATRTTVENVCETLCYHGISATRYHAGLSEEERRQNQNDFQFDRKSIIVATNAFGMGIDKSNVNFVIHYNMPKSLEAYYQEAGRAGRDGAPADCILLYSGSDVKTAEFFIQNNSNEALDSETQRLVRKCDEARLKAMVGYCKTTHCLRGHLLDYFGQAHQETCDNCGNCHVTYRNENITTPAQMILSCVQRVKNQLGYYVGKGLIVRILHGSKEQRVLELKLDQLSTYGLLQQMPSKTIRAYLDFLESEGYLLVNTEHSTLQLTKTAAAVLFEGREVFMPVRVEAPPPHQEHTQTRTAAGAVKLGPVDEVLLDTLKDVRTRVAKREGVPVYIVFSNATLIEMTTKQPSTRAEFLSISGVGETKANRYGAAFLDAIRTHRERYEAVSDESEPA